MRVCVAGGTGAPGRPLVPQLVARGHQVTAMTTSAAPLGQVGPTTGDGLVPGHRRQSPLVGDGAGCAVRSHIDDAASAVLAAGRGRQPRCPLWRQGGKEGAA
ncbi:hypothetical protein AB0L59_36325 [Streptomyces sp. NPDC052109]|uniref:hypothetical protein n=1 Tax=Streptomyces sp. NPDC052109 TaxID=3155527 RepID=UPI00342AE6C9